MNWALIAEKIEHALTLDNAQLVDYLNTISGTPEAVDITRLLQLTHPATGFLSTTAPNEYVEQTQLESGAIIDCWQIDRHLGRGGMGDVYKATRADGLYEQTVALKIIQGVSQARSNWFETERKRLALMNHPGIARIIDGGTTVDDRGYMVMEFIDGEDIGTFVSSKSLTVNQTIQLFSAVCDSVEHAHSKLILHRDIKIDNIIIASDETPKLIDFGIAYNLAGDNNASSVLSITTAAPEQLKGESLSVQTDIFSLAVVLHELLTGHRPKRLADAGVELDQVSINNVDLTAILQRATLLEANQRYSSVSEFKDDLMALVEKRPVHARQGGWSYRALRFMQRYPLPTGLASLTIIAILVGLTVSIKFADEAQHEAERANSALAEAEDNLKRAQYYLNRADLFYATQAAYADSLQSMFGNDADVARQTKVLKDRWQRAHNLRHEDSDNAAYLSYAIGRHFLFRNDYLTTIEILKPWIEEAYGPEPLISHGAHLLAIAYMSTGKEDDALPMLQVVEQTLASSYDARSAEHISATTQIASITREDADLERAIELLNYGLSKNNFDEINMYYLHQISLMQSMRGNFDDAYQASIKTYDIIKDKPLMGRSGTDTGILRLIDFEIMHTNDLDRAEELLEKVMAATIEHKGESRELGVAFSISSMINFARGNNELARQEIDKAITLVEKYTGLTSALVTNLRIQRAEILASLKQYSATTELEETIALLTNDDGTQRAKTRTDLANIFITVQLDGLEAGQKRLAQLNPDKKAISRNLELSYAWNNLKALGL